MNYFDNEENILEWFRNTFEQQVLFPIENAECIELYLSLSDEQRSPDWINSSGKGDPPPDFYNPQINKMMDVMRVDDHGHVVGKGKYINPVNQRESKIQRELRETGFLDMFPNLQSVFVNAVTDLPEKEEHNYQFYVENFKRTLEKHIKSIPLYRKNHPILKLYFLYLMSRADMWWQIISSKLKEEYVRVKCFIVIHIFVLWISGLLRCLSEQI